MSKPVESAEEFCLRAARECVMGDTDRVQLALLIEADRNAVRLEVIEELERVAANARWLDDRHMLEGAGKLLRAKYGGA